jgi:biopolymer transport protein ExbD
MNLPAKDSTRLIHPDDLLRFELDSTGALLFGGGSMSITVAERELRAAVASNPNLAVLLSIDPAAPWQKVVSFVELAQKLRIDSFSFVVKEAL